MILLSESWPLTNSGINSGDNLILVMNAINHRTPDRRLAVTFDEFHHGYGRGEGIMSLITGPARWGLAEILVAFVLMIFATSRRFGVPINLREGIRQRGEYLGSMSSLLRRAKATDIVRKRLGRRFMEEAARAVGLPPNSSADDIVAAAEQRRPDIAGELRKLVIEAASVNAREDEANVLALARAWHKMRKELTK